MAPRVLVTRRGRDTERGKLPMYSNPSKLTPTARFASAVIPGPECWLWPTPPTTGRKYPTVHWYGRRISVNRVAWAVATGAPPPAGLCVCHTCDNPCCVRNDAPGTYEVRGVLLPRWGHLWLGTIAQNSADMVDKGRSMTGERNPSRTHPEAFVGKHHRLQGEAHWHAKHTDAEVLAMRQDYRNGMTTPELRIKYGAPKGRVWAIVTRQSWRHLP
jgi:hypothetical protein